MLLFPVYDSTRSLYDADDRADDEECRDEIDDTEYGYDESDRDNDEEFFPEYERLSSELFYRETWKSENRDEFRENKTEYKGENSE